MTFVTSALVFAKQRLGLGAPVGKLLLQRQEHAIDSRYSFCIGNHLRTLAFFLCRFHTSSPPILDCCAFVFAGFGLYGAALDRTRSNSDAGRRIRPSSVSARILPP